MKLETNSVIKVTKERHKVTKDSNRRATSTTCSGKTYIELKALAQDSHMKEIVHRTCPHQSTNFCREDVTPKERLRSTSIIHVESINNTSIPASFLPVSSCIAWFFAFSFNVT